MKEYFEFENLCGCSEFTGMHKHPVLVELKKELTKLPEKIVGYQHPPSDEWVIVIDKINEILEYLKDKND